MPGKWQLSSRSPGWCRGSEQPGGRFFHCRPPGWSAAPPLPTSVHDGLIGDLQQQPKLGVHCVRLLGVDSKEGGIELGQVLQLARPPGQAVEPCGHRERFHPYRGICGCHRRLEPWGIMKPCSSVALGSHQGGLPPPKKEPSRATLWVGPRAQTAVGSRELSLLLTRPQWGDPLPVLRLARPAPPC